MEMSVVIFLLCLAIVLFFVSKWMYRGLKTVWFWVIGIIGILNLLYAIVFLMLTWDKMIFNLLFMSFPVMSFGFGRVYWDKKKLR